jgi:pentalenene oxygenase
MARHAVTMSRLAVAMAQEWRPGATLDVEDAMTTLTSRVTGHVLMSDSLDAATAAEVRACLPVVMRGVMIRAALPRYERYRLLLPDNRRFERSLSRLHRIVDRIIDERRRTGADHGDLLAALLRAKDDDGDALSDQEVHDQVITFLAAAIDTTAQALAWTYRLLADHPDAERRMHAELDTVLDGGRPPRLEDLPHLVHTRRVVTESLRMYPPGWIFTRVTTTATTLAGQRLPAGATILYSPYALHHDPASFTDPERFDPDRWTPAREADVPRGAMLPFGAGSRKCAGDTFAMTQALLTIAAVSTRWRLRPLTDLPARPAISAILGPGPLPMTCEPRRAAGRRKTGE